MLRNIKRKIRRTRLPEKSTSKFSSQLYTLQEIAASLSNSMLIPDSAGDTIVSRIVEDSRLVVPGTLFIATSKSNLDGHIFVRRAVSNGATAVIIESTHELEFTNLIVPKIIVSDMHDAVEQVINAWKDIFIASAQTPIYKKKENQIENISPNEAANIRIDTLPVALHSRISNHGRKVSHPMAIATLLASLSVAVLCFYINEYASVSVNVRILSKLKADLKVSEQREVDLKNAISQARLSTKSRAQALGLVPVSPKDVNLLAD